MKNRCQNGTQKIMKWTKNATKINEKVEGRRGKGRKGKGKERKREDRRGEGRKGEERKPTGRGGGAPAGQRQLGGGLINLKGGDPPWPRLGWLVSPRSPPGTIFSDFSGFWTHFFRSRKPSKKQPVPKPQKIKKIDPRAPQGQIL